MKIVARPEDSTHVRAAGGLTYPELIDELIALALERRTGLR